MRKLLIANRGEIAVRVVHACADAGLVSVAVYADPDADALHVALADEAYSLDGMTAAETYLDIGKLIAIARRSGAAAVHPGYGFLAENADFAQAVLDAGLTWVGPSPQTIRALGNKVTAREIARRAGAPLVPGSDGPVPSAAEARAFAEAHGLPIVVKAAFGGGGRGLRVVRDLDDVEHAFASAQAEARAAFGRDECFVERFLDRPRHIEAQVLADSHGAVVVVGTRDCSLQRRNQKLVEEAPAPFLTVDQRRQLHDAARAICTEAGYVGAGTVEFLLGEDGSLSFLEVNTRLQVEHPVTELTSGIDLVAAQLVIADGGEVPVLTDPEPFGHAIELRINAEDGSRGFLPATGTITTLHLPTGPGVRVDTGVRAGSVVSGHFDSLLAKVIVHGRDRDHALRRARRAAREMEIAGVATVLPFHRAVLADDAFHRADRLGVWTTWIESELVPRLDTDPEFRQAPVDEGRWRFVVDVDGRRVTLGLPADLLDAFAARDGLAVGRQPEEPQDPAVLAAPMGGSLVRWLVCPGSHVDESEAVLVLEAMKMETTVVAHRAGVLEPRVSVGDRVQQGQDLARIAQEATDNVAR
ncbi:biotin carboxylase N-terminal domain-containing protein [Cellulomonas fimi]|uniref:biotin carboxylase n=1 Tax=Cellulomonas fimi TaxID=1708 RepID=A0A7Y0QFP6_CELFI|nr:biotin carboxylase N-terminal domain-containing protein [Cellulomonas fimi]NMR19276.1 ATP-grasp domain-containing protein [Cellulomonas fimi]